MATIVGLNINTYTINAAVSMPPLNLSIEDQLIGLFGGDYFDINPPGYAVINGHTTLINPDYTSTADTSSNGYYLVNTNATTVSYGPLNLSSNSLINNVTGDMTDLSFNADASTYTSNPYIAVYSALVNTTFNLGTVDSNTGLIDQGNTITVGSGINTIDGNVQNLDITAVGSSHSVGPVDYSYYTDQFTTTGPDVEGVIENLTVNMGDNRITAGSGTNNISGDANAVLIEAIGGGNYSTNDPGSTFGGFTQSLIGLGVGSSPVLTGGDNTISVGGGLNVVAGDSNSITLEATGGYDGVYNQGYNSAQVETVHIYDGYNSITASGFGLDTIAGGAFNLTYEAIGGYANNGRGAGAEIEGSYYDADGTHLSNNTITVTGSGADAIFGSVENLTLEAIGGTVLGNGFDTPLDPNASFLDALTGLRDTSISDVAAGVSGLNIFLGDNTIDVHNSSATMVIDGDAQDINFIATGGTVNGDGGYADAFVANNAITGGGDTILGGSGQTIIYGDAKLVDFQFTNGDNDATNPAHGYALAVMYPDLILNSSTLVNQTDLAFGNAFENNGVGKYETIGTGNILTFNGDDITAGSGTTTVYSHVGSFEGLSQFLNTDGYLDANNPNSLGNQNQLYMGNDTLTAGSGKDTFAFDLMNIGNVGNDPFVLQGNNSTASTIDIGVGDYTTVINTNTTGSNEIVGFKVGTDNLEFDELTMSQFLSDAHVSDTANGTLIQFGSYTKTIEVQNFYGSASNLVSTPYNGNYIGTDYGLSDLDYESVYIDPSNGKQVISIVNNDGTNAAINSFLAAVPNNVEVVYTTNSTVPADTVISGDAGAHLSYSPMSYSINGSVLLEGVHLSPSHESAAGLIQALGATHVIV